MKQLLLIKQIKALKKQKNAVILAHNYERPEIYEVADFIGDSLELAKAAAKTKAKIIVFCGVDFMAESAKILNPTKKVLLPVLDARCPMANMVDLEKLKKLQKKYPQAQTVAYVNTSAKTKAESDICCTSANAIKIVKKLPAQQIIFLPDKNLAAYVQNQLPQKQIIPWEGFCYVHSNITEEKLKVARDLHPAAKIMAHPECPMKIIEQADVVASTSQMIDYAKSSPAKEFIVVTEMGMTNRLVREVAEKKFYTVGGVCVQMKKIRLADVLKSLKEENFEIILPPKIRKNAATALRKMML